MTKLCICGCGKEIIEKKHHKKTGLPNYIHGHNPNSGRFQKGRKPNMHMLGKKHSLETKQKMSESHKKLLDWHKNKKTMLGKHHSEETKIKMSIASKGKPKLYMQGEKHPFWRGGEIKKRKGHQWKLIRKEVLIKYGFKCIHCGKTEDIDIHHKIPYRKVKEHKIENLIPLCKSCHIKEEWKIKGD